MSDIELSERAVIVDGQWFDKLESYLDADERFASLPGRELILFTYDAKKLIFKRRIDK